MSENVPTDVDQNGWQPSEDGPLGTSSKLTVAPASSVACVLPLLYAEPS